MSKVLFSSGVLIVKKFTDIKIENLKGQSIFKTANAGARRRRLPCHKQMVVLLNCLFNFGKR